MRGIIFDFNGTMLFDEKFQTISWRTFLQDKTGRSITDREFQEYIHGRNAEAIFSYFLSKTPTREETLALEEEKERIYRALCLESQEFHLAAGLPEFLDALVKNHIPLTIATASGSNNVKFFFRHLHLDRWFPFDKVVYNDGMMRGKPEPDIFLKAANNIGVNRENCIVFEDSKSGIEAAKRASVSKIIGVASTQSSKELQESGVTDIIQDYSDLNKLLKMVGINPR